MLENAWEMFLLVAKKWVRGEVFRGFCLFVCFSLRVGFHGVPELFSFF